LQANLIWSYAKLGHIHDQLLSNAALIAEDSVQELSMQHLANIAWSYATLNFHASGMFQAFAAELKKRISGNLVESISAFQLANVIWSLSITDEMSENSWYAEFLWYCSIIDCDQLCSTLALFPAGFFSQIMSWDSLKTKPVLPLSLSCKFFKQS